MLRSFALAAVFGLGLGPSAAVAQAPVRYDFDPAHTYLGFNVRHMMVTNVKGRFNTFTGAIMLDTADITRSNARLEIDVASVDTDNQRRDDDLRSANFFEVEKFPKLNFASTRIEKSAGGGLALVGNLTIRDVTREVRIPFEMAGPIDTGNGQKRLGVEATLRIDRKDWGLTWNRAIETGGVVVGDEVRIEINVEARLARQG